MLSPHHTAMLSTQEHPAVVLVVPGAAPGPSPTMGREEPGWSSSHAHTQGTWVAAEGRIHI